MDGTGPLSPDDAIHAARRATFRWDLPARCNIAETCLGPWLAAEPERVCLIEDRGAGSSPVETSYAALADRAARFAAVLSDLGVSRGDFVGIVLPQSVETAAAHLAAYRLGAVAVPLALRFGPEALGFRLARAGVSALVTNPEGLGTLSALAEPLPALRRVLSVSGPAEGALDLARLAAEADPARAPAAETGPDDPALLIFTSGTTGNPKGALHGHRVLAGHLPGFVMAHEDLPQPGDAMWTPADWAWAGGLLNALLPSLHFGVPVVFSSARFSGAEALALMTRRGVRNAFLPATALRLMQSAASGLERPPVGLSLRTILSAGETLPAATHAWARAFFGCPVNEAFGQTECNLVLASAEGWGVSKPGSIGKAVPGHRVAILDPEGREVAPGTPGEIAVAAPDPVMFLGYLGDPGATRAKIRGDWLMTGDQGVTDTEGYVSFVGRDDDIITSAGYRIGPGEVENCLLTHPACALVAVVGKPDPVRTEIVKAYVVPADGIRADEALAEALKRHVRERLSPHEYPREIGFVDEMPLTTSGKIMRRVFRDMARTEAEAESEPRPLSAGEDPPAARA